MPGSISLHPWLIINNATSDQDYFSAHGPDALLIAQTVYKTTNVIRYLGSATATSAANSGASSSSTNQKKGLPSLTLSTTLAKGFLREALTSKQMRVEIWEGEGGKKQGNRWELGKEASYHSSPGLQSASRSQAYTAIEHVLYRHLPVTSNRWKTSSSPRPTISLRRSLWPSSSCSRMEALPG